MWWRHGDERMLSNPRPSSPGGLPKAFRHTYCAARLQTLDQGAPVSTYTVARELGHEPNAMVRRVYAHLGTIRHRSDVLEYRVEQHLERLGAPARRGAVFFATTGPSVARGPRVLTPSARYDPNSTMKRLSARVPVGAKQRTEET